MSDGWEWDGNEWRHCGRRAWCADDGVTCSKCQDSFSWDDDEEDDDDVVCRCSACDPDDDDGVFVCWCSACHPDDKPADESANFLTETEGQ